MQAKARQFFRRRSSSGEQMNTGDIDVRHPGWTELIFDLVIVASISALGEVLKNNLTSDDALVSIGSPFLYFLLFVPIYQHWGSVDRLLNRYELTGWLPAVFMFLHIVLIAFTNITIIELSETEIGVQSAKQTEAIMTYLACALLSNVLSVIEYGSIMVLNPTLARPTVVFVVVHALTSVLWGIQMLLLHFFEADYQFCVLAGFVLQLVLTWNFISILGKVGRFLTDSGIIDMLGLQGPDRIPIHVSLMAERLSLLIVIAIGECFMATIASDNEISWRKLFNIAIAAIHAILLKENFFEVLDVPGEEAKKHALKISLHSGTSWLNAHILLTVAVTLSANLLENDEDGTVIP